MSNIFVKQNDIPIDIESVYNEHEASKDFKPSFWYWNRRYYLSDFTQLHNNPWINDDYPEHIHAIQADEYRSPLFLEVTDDGKLNVYKEAA